MMFGVVFSVAQKQSAEKARREALCAQMSAHAYAAWQKHGDAFAGMDYRGNVILWRKTRIPTVRKGQ